MLYTFLSEAHCFMKQDMMLWCKGWYAKNLQDWEIDSDMNSLCHISLLWYILHPPPTNSISLNISLQTNMAKIQSHYSFTHFGSPNFWLHSHVAITCTPKVSRNKGYVHTAGKSVLNLFLQMWHICYLHGCLNSKKHTESDIFNSDLGHFHVVLKSSIYLICGNATSVWTNN